MFICALQAQNLFYIIRNNNNATYFSLLFRVLFFVSRKNGIWENSFQYQSIRKASNSFFHIHTILFESQFHMRSRRVLTKPFISDSNVNFDNVIVLFRQQNYLSVLPFQAISTYTNNNNNLWSILYALHTHTKHIKPYFDTKMLLSEKQSTTINKHFKMAENYVNES